MNPPIPFVPCGYCGLLTNETQSVAGVAHYDCFIARAPRYEPPKDFDAWLKGAERYEAESVVEADGYAGA